jgi:ribonuclease HI
MQPDATLTISCDGLCEPRNPGGWACWAWLAIGPNGKRLRDAWGCLGHGAEMSNNRAEYQAVIEALRYTVTRTELLAARGVSIVVRSDSQLVINQVVGSWACRTPHLIPLRAEIERLAEELHAAGIAVRFAWIPREQNTEADALTRRAYREARLHAGRQIVERH